MLVALHDDATGGCARALHSARHGRGEPVGEGALGDQAILAHGTAGLILIVPDLILIVALSCHDGRTSDLQTPERGRCSAHAVP